MPPTTTVKPDPSDERFVQAELKGRRLGRALTKLGKVTREQVHQALALQQGEKKGKKLGQILVEMELITASDLQAALWMKLCKVVAHKMRGRVDMRKCSLVRVRMLILSFPKSPFPRVLN